VAFDSREKEVAEAVVLQVATENADRAVALRDEGKLEEAQGVLEANASYSSTNPPLSWDSEQALRICGRQRRVTPKKSSKEIGLNSVR
jgi:hypothetical protein